MLNTLEEILIAVITIVGMWLAFWVYFTNKKEKLNQWFAIMTFLVILWADFSFLGYNTRNIFSALLFYRLNFVFVSLFSIASFYFFIIYFLKQDKKYRILRKIIVILGIVFAVLSLFSDLIIKEVVARDWGFEIIFGAGNDFFNLYGLSVSLLIIILLIKKYFYINRKQKQKIKYFLVGTSLFVFFNIIFNVIFPFLLGTIEYARFGDYSAIFLLGFTAYAIVKHELMGIKTLITQILIIIISIILLIDTLLLSSDIAMQLLKFGVLVTFLYFSRGMVNSAKKEKRAREKLEESHKRIDQNVRDLRDMNIKLKERNEDLGVLLNISDITTETLDPKKIAQDIVNSVPKNLNHLKYVAGFMVLYDAKNEQTYAYFVTESIITKRIKKLFEKTFERKSELIRVRLDSDNLISKTIRRREIQISNKLEDFISPSIDMGVCRVIQKLTRSKSYVSVPLSSSGRVIGAIVFVSIKSKEEIIQRDKRILFGFSSHIGSAIENAELYKKTNMQMKELGMLNTSLKSMNQNLEELLEMKNEFLHITSHQLRTPLTAIRGMLSMWYEGDFENLPEKEKKRILKRILVSADRLNNITNDMLDTMELEGGFLRFKFKSVSIAKIIKETIDTLKPNFDKKNIYIRLKVNTKNSDAEVEPNYIRQVFMNIIDNACKYTKEGGVSISVEKDGKYVKVSIKDTGVGIGKVDQKKIFDKFTRGENAVSENASGSGLGLFIAKKIIKEHGGKIKIESKGIGRGSTVKINLRINNN